MLDSYDAERRPIADLTVEQAYTRYVQRVDPSLPADDLAAPLDDPSIELGSIYRSAAVIGAPSGDALVENPHAPSAAPGTRVPHIALDQGRSTLDLPGNGFALLTASPAWAEAAPASLAAHRVAESTAAALGIGTQGALILRPDAVIGWRTGGPAGEPRTLLDAAMRQLTMR